MKAKNTKLEKAKKARKTATPMMTTNEILANMALIDCRKRLKAIAEILEAVDNRCMAADGDVTPTKDEITADELKKIYQLAIGVGSQTGDVTDIRTGLRKLDANGRCCGRKPLEYKSRWSTAEGAHRYCPRCDRAYHITENRQIKNWAWDSMGIKDVDT